MNFLTLLDTAGIQEYIYRKHDLRSIAASSALIENLGGLDGKFAKAVQSQGGRLLSAAGGNAAFMTETKDSARSAVRAVSRSLLLSGRGLEAVAAIVPYNKGDLPGAYMQCLAELDARKLIQPRSIRYRLSGLEDAEPIASDTPSLSGFQKFADDLILPTEFERVICDGGGEKSDMMAVVSVDGMGMGRKIDHWLKDMRGTGDERFCSEISTWSEGLKLRWTSAWNQALTTAAELFTTPSYEYVHPYFAERSIKLKAEGPFRFLPMRLIYQGGDDLMFVCDARLGMSLASMIVTELEDETENNCVPSQFRRIAASVGVLFVDSHYPFYRAAQLADDVRRLAKKRNAENNLATSESADVSTVDWWVNRPGSSSRGPEGLTFRPMPFYGDYDSWHWFETKVLDRLWRTFAASRNKLKDVVLAAESGSGGTEVERVLRLRPLDCGDLQFDERFLPEPGKPATGFSGGRTPLVDAAELYDIHFPVRRHENLNER